MFFLSPWVVYVVGVLVHYFVDKVPARRTGHRFVELALLWLLVLFGFMAILGGVSHIGPTSTQIAEQIGYVQSMFQWEVGWADIALGVLGVACAWQRFRDGWMTAAVVTMVIMYWGDAIGHVMEYVTYDNAAPGNFWAIPADFLQPLLAVVLLIIYRRGQSVRQP